MNISAEIIIDDTFYHSNDQMVEINPIGVNSVNILLRQPIEIEEETPKSTKKKGFFRLKRAW